MAKPAQRSSMVTAFRALFMLCCLLAIPLAAMLGKTFPGAVDRIMAGKWPINSEDENPTSDDTVNSSRYAAASGGLVGPAPTTDDVLDRPFLAEGDVSEGVVSLRPNAASTVGASGNGMSGVPVNSGRVVPVSYQAPIGTGGGPSLVPSSVSNAAIPIGSAGVAASSFTSGSSSLLLGQDRFSRMLNRFRELGAVNYRMEYWGGGKDYYRFQCRMAVDNSVGFTCHFEATGIDALQVMAEVLERVQQWSNQQMLDANSPVPNSSSDMTSGANPSVVGATAPRGRLNSQFAPGLLR